jgi:transposase
VKAWRADRARTPAQAFIPLRFDPGEAYQFDWSHEGIELHSLPVTIKLAQMRLSYSRMPIVRAYFRETQEMVFDAHDKAFAFYGGVCRRGIYDNMKTAMETSTPSCSKTRPSMRAKSGNSRAATLSKPNATSF